MNKKYDNLPIVAMTADAMTGVRERVLRIGMNDYVTKPIETHSLWEALVKLIDPGERILPEYYTNETNLESVREEQTIIPPFACLK